ncbi:MAG TPA: hypothetical protein VGJ48_12170 [Pyrinomonadaceae bacterium]
MLRLGGGEPLLGLPHFIPYPELLSRFFPGDALSWYEPGTGAMLFPFKTLAMVTGLILLPAVSRLTAYWSAPLPLRNVATED